MSSLLAAKRKLLEEDNYKRKSKHDGRDKYEEKSSKKKKSKDKKCKKKSKKKRKESSSSDSSDSDESDEWVEKAPQAPTSDANDKKESQREDWMSMMGSFKTFDREKTKPDPKEKKGHIDAYVPSQSARELNPYWKDNGTGLPSLQSHSRSSAAFKKPSHHEDDFDYDRKSGKSAYDRYQKSKNWQKNSRNVPADDYSTSTSGSSNFPTPKPTIKSEEPKRDQGGSYMTDEEMNRLGARVVKAEILGNTQLVEELKLKLETAREYRKNHPDEKPSTSEKDLMLTMTDAKGNSVPLRKSQNAGDVRSKGGKKTMETHSMNGERVRFFADDDKYSLKQMFEKEKFGSADDSKEEFAMAISKHRNPNDDLDDIFSEKITKKVSDAKSDQRDMQKAISQQQTIQRSLDSCEMCVDSDKMSKHALVTLGEKVYLSLPERMSLVENHCIISTVSHAASCTMIDEDVWREILTFRKALVKMFNSRNEDVVFFETAVNLHKYPHMTVHCVPLPRDVGDMAAIYFKKAILECEAEWSDNKKVIDLRGKDVRRGVPKGLPYFWIDFGMDPGFAHIIEDQHLFPRNFAQEIIGGFLDLDHGLWRKPHRESFERQRKKVTEFSKIWKQHNPIEDSKN